MFKRNSSFHLAINFVAFALSSCNESEKKLGAAERRQRKLETENYDINMQSLSRLDALKRAAACDNAVWVLATVEINYTDAVAVCSSMSYQLLTESNLSDLKQRDPQTTANKLTEAFAADPSGRYNEIHVRDKTVDLAKGVVI